MASKMKAMSCPRMHLIAREQRGNISVLTMVYRPYPDAFWTEAHQCR